MSRRKNKKYYILLIILLLLGVTFGYAVLNSTLNINGKSTIQKNTWNVHFENVQITTGSVEATKVPAIENSTTVDFEAQLNLPGDFYEFTIDVVNDGTIDAMIDCITKTPTLTEAQAKYLNYIIEYQNGESINTKQLVAKNSFVRLKVRVEYRKDITASDLPTTSETLNLSFTVNYVQSDGTASSVADNGVYDPYKIGNEKCFGSECFYIISSTEETVTMLAKYNLYVGGEYNSSWTAYGEEATGKQNSNMLGYVRGQSIRKGTTKFSNTNYWTSTVSSYPAYVYDSNSTLYSYVENYKTYLSTLGVTPIEARLITYEELESLGCSGSDNSCSEAPEWVYATTYWSGSAYNAYDVWFVGSYGGFGGDFYSSDSRYGVRPVITISKSLI